jgi:hypothetical protein
MSKNGCLTRKTRHIERYFYFAREGQQNGLHNLHWLATCIKHASSQHNDKVANCLQTAPTECSCCLTEAHDLQIIPYLNLSAQISIDLKRGGTVSAYSSSSSSSSIVLLH